MAQMSEEMDADLSDDTVAKKGVKTKESMKKVMKQPRKGIIKKVGVLKKPVASSSVLKKPVAAPSSSSTGGNDTDGGDDDDCELRNICKNKAFNRLWDALPDTVRRMADDMKAQKGGRQQMTKLINQSIVKSPKGTYDVAKKIEDLPIYKEWRSCSDKKYFDDYGAGCLYVKMGS